MIKCPNCGSTAQVRILNVMMCREYVEVEYTCGCLLHSGEGAKTATTRLTLEQWEAIQ